MFLKDNFWITSIVVLFAFSNLIFLNFYNDIPWDSAVYIGMA